MASQAGTVFLAINFVCVGSNQTRLFFRHRAKIFDLPQSTPYFVPKFCSQSAARIAKVICRLAQIRSRVRLWKSKSDRSSAVLLRSLAYLYLSAFFLMSACAVSTQITNTPRSSFEQRLLVRALERAIAGLDAQQFKGKTAAIDFFGLTADKDFAKEFVTAWFQSQGVRIATNGGQAQLHLKVFASALAVDQGQSFFGMPSFTVPLTPVDVWPWLAQLGKDRGGLYSFDGLENLVGCGIHSAPHDLPEHQCVTVGDLIRLGPDGYPCYRAR